MGLVFKDCVRCTSSVMTGANQPIVLDVCDYAGAKKFSDVVPDGSTCYIKIDGRTTGQWEIRLCSYTLSTNTLSAGTEIIASSEVTNTAVTFVSGVKDVFLIWPALRANYLPAQVQAPSSLPSSAVAVNTYCVASGNGKLSSVGVTGGATLTANDSNYLTFTVTNLSNSSAVMLAVSDANTTKATGGTGIVTDTLRALTLTSTAANLLVNQGDKLKITATGTGTPTALTFPIYLLNFSGV